MTCPHGECVINGDCSNVLPSLLQRYPDAIIVSDPPFNVGYHYAKYLDRMPDNEYYAMMAEIFSSAPSVVIHYPESLHRLSIEIGRAPDKVVSWVYNSNTAKQHRDVAFYGVNPDFDKVRQPYKNQNDPRIRKRMQEGHRGGRLYDWWNVNQVKNVSECKTSHPCQMPIEVMTNIIGILPEVPIIDPFCGSGTTGIACKILEREFVGIELDEGYSKLANRMIRDYAVNVPLFKEDE